MVIFRNARNSITLKQMTDRRRMLIYGYGNPGRQDDGLGKALIDLAESRLPKEYLENITLDVGYQLQVEDVILLKEHDLVIFVDASMDEKIGDFGIDAVSADGKTTFTMHSVSPGFIIALYESMYGKSPPAYLLQIRGYEWEMEESLSPGAQKNLAKAWAALREIIRNPDLLTDENFFTRISSDNGLKA